MPLTELLMFLLRNWTVAIKPLLDETINEILKIGDKNMSNKNNLYFEKTGCEKNTQVKAAFIEAVNGNYKFYRCVHGKTGEYYGWNEKGNRCFLISDGTDNTVWAENPHYVEPETKTVDIEEDTAIAETVEATAAEATATETAATVATLSATVEEATTAEVAIETVVEATETAVTAETATAEETAEASTVEAVEAETEAVEAKKVEAISAVQAETVNYKTLYEELEKRFAEQVKIANAATDKMNKIKDAMKKAAEIIIEVIGE